MTEIAEVKPAYAYTAKEVNDRIRSLAINRKSNRGVGDCVKTGIEFFDKRNVPMTRGTIATIVGQTNHGKSPLAATIAYNVKESLKKYDSPGSVVVFLTEETVEKREIQMWGDSRIGLRDILLGNAKLDVIDDNIAKSNSDPVYFVGDTADIASADMNDETLGAMTPHRIGITLQKLVRMGVQPELVVIDHVHDLQLEKPPRDEGELYETIGRQLIALASALKPYCPVLYVCQAKKEVGSRPAGIQRIPEVGDIKYMSSLIHKTSHCYSISYPKKYMKDQIVKAGNGEFRATTGLFIVSGAKLRDGDSGESCVMTTLDGDSRWTGLLKELKEEK